MQNELFIQQFVTQVARRDRRERVAAVVLVTTIIAFLLFLPTSLLDSWRPLPFGVRAAILFLSLLIIWLANLIILRSSREPARQVRPEPIRRAAKLIEQAKPPLRNELITVVETFGSSDHSTQLPSYLRNRLMARLAGSITDLALTDVVPYKRLHAFGAIVIVLAAMTLGFALVSPTRFVSSLERLILLRHDTGLHIPAAASGSKALKSVTAIPISIESLLVTYHYPKYTGLPDMIQRDNGNLAAVAGTKVELGIKSKGDLSGISLSVGGKPEATFKQRNREWLGEIELRQTVNYEVDLLSATGETSPPAIYTIQILPDLPPEAHITEPKNDLLFSARNRPSLVRVRYALQDDFGLGPAELKYIKTTGEGDSAKFESGSLALKGGAGRSFSGEIELDLNQLKLQPGDSIVYHVEARDRNNITGPNVGYSENQVIQIAAPESETIALDDLRPEDLDRTLLSERMILMHTESLQSQHARLSHPDLVDRSNTIAVDQKTLRRRYVSFNGDEEDHAPEASTGDATKSSVETQLAAVEERLNDQLQVHDHGIIDAPQGGRETIRHMVLAIRAMWQAEGSLGQGELAPALAAEHSALEHLKQAQAGMRYFPKVIVKTRPIDLKRRYAGNLDDIKARLERPSPSTASPQEKQVQNLLRPLYGLLTRLGAARRGQGRETIDMLFPLADQVETQADGLLKLEWPFPAAIAESVAKLKLGSRAVRSLATAEGDMRGQDKAAVLLSQAAMELISIVDSSNGSGARGSVAEENQLLAPERAMEQRYIDNLRRRRPR